MRRDIQRLTGLAAPLVSGPPVAAGRFEPNIARWTPYGLFAPIAVAVNWRRERQALDSGLALAPHSFVLVTTDEVDVFDGTLLRFKAFRQLLRQPRHDLVARAVARPKAAPPEARSADYYWPALRLEDRAGRPLAELAPKYWQDDEKAVFRELTGYPGWPPGSLPPNRTAPRSRR